MTRLIRSLFKVVLMLSLSIAVYNDRSQSAVLIYMPKPNLKDTNEIQTDGESKERYICKMFIRSGSNFSKELMTSNLGV